MLMGNEEYVYLLYFLLIDDQLCLVVPMYSKLILSYEKLCIYIIVVHK